MDELSGFRLLPTAFQPLSFPPHCPIMLLTKAALLLGLTAYVSAIIMEDSARALAAQRSAAGTDDWPIGTQTGDGQCACTIHTVRVIT